MDIALAATKLLNIALNLLQGVVYLLPQYFHSTPTSYLYFSVTCGPVVDFVVKPTLSRSRAMVGVLIAVASGRPEPAESLAFTSRDSEFM